MTRRIGFRKVYDLTERVIPSEHLNARPHPAETIEVLCTGALDRLGFATSGDLAAFWPEDGVRMGTGRCRALQAELERAAVFGACAEVRFAEGWLRDG